MNVEKYQELVEMFEQLQKLGKAGGLTGKEIVKHQYNEFHFRFSFIQEAIEKKSSISVIQSGIAASITALIWLQECTTIVDYSTIIVKNLNEINSFTAIYKEQNNGFEKDLVNFRWAVSPHVPVVYLLNHFIGLCLAYGYDVGYCIENYVK